MDCVWNDRCYGEAECVRAVFVVVKVGTNFLILDIIFGNRVGDEAFGSFTVFL